MTEYWVSAQNTEVGQRPRNQINSGRSSDCYLHDLTQGLQQLRCVPPANYPDDLALDLVEESVGLDDDLAVVRIRELRYGVAKLGVVDPPTTSLFVDSFKGHYRTRLVRLDIPNRRQELIGLLRACPTGGNITDENGIRGPFSAPALLGKG